MSSNPALATHHPPRRAGRRPRLVLAFFVQSLTAVVLSGSAPAPVTTGVLAELARTPAADGIVADAPYRPLPRQVHLTPLDLTQLRAAEPAATTAVGKARLIPATGGFRITVAGWTRTITPGNQATIDRCRATLWRGPMPGASGRGTTWLAGHNYCGFYRWDTALHVGSRFVITGPSGNVMWYRVFARGYVGRHGGSTRGLIRGDVTLQTCRGIGTAFAYARRIHSS